MDETQVTDPFLFALSVLTLLGTPGPTNTLLATSGAVVGPRRSLPLLAGELTGYLLAIVIIRLSLGTVLATEPMVGSILKVFVALYLIFVALKLWSVPIVAAIPSIVKTSSVFTTTLCNPKAFIFALYIIPHEHPVPYLIAFSGCVVVVGFMWTVFGHLAGSKHSTLVPRLALVALGSFAGLILISIFR
jgi:threonine/homoserine/homoserine lactone efflux protein